MKIRFFSKQGRQETKAEIKDKTRSAEILGVFAKHNFYAGGLTPEELRTTLEDLGPTYIKIGQIASSRTDLLPERYCRELEKLRSNVAPLDFEIVRQVIEQETGKKLEEIYSEFQSKPLGSASIAQAHYGILKDGTRVVTKVQRPQIAEKMRKDFVLLNKLAGFANAAGNEENSTVDLKSVLKELEKVTEDELDFHVEAENTRSFSRFCISDKTVVGCPEIVDELTTERILTMTYVDGFSIAEKERIDEEGYDRTAIGSALLENYLHQVLDAGIFHGDPHQGNIMLSHGVPYWIDFGMIGKVSEQCIDTIQDILFSLIQRDIEGLTNAAMSFGRPTGKINKSRLMDDIDGIIEQYGSVASIDVGALMTDLINLLSAHGMTVPGEYTMLIRSLVTLQGVLSDFCPELDLFPFLTKRLLQRAKDNFDIKEKLTTAVESLAMTGIKTSRLPSMTFDVLRNLVKGRMKIGLELTGYDELLSRLNDSLKNVVLAVFACVLFAGSCILCTTNIHPQTNGVPLVALIGFVVAVALGIYSVVNMGSKKK